LAPIWRALLPTAIGLHPAIYAFAQGVVRTPVIGEALYRLNIHPRVIRMM
jgi:hypothetical protein